MRIWTRCKSGNIRHMLSYCDTGLLDEPLLYASQGSAFLSPLQFRHDCVPGLLDGRSVNLEIIDA
jgi:hypothetical protein